MCGPSRSSGPRPRGSRGRDGPRRADRRHRAALDRLDAAVPRHGHRHAKPTVDEAPRPPPPDRPPRSRRGVVGELVPGRGQPGGREVEGRGASPLFVGGTGCTTARCSTTSTSPASGPRSRPSSRRNPTRPTSTPDSSSSTPSPRSRMDPENRRRVVRALEVTIGGGRRFSDYGPGLDRYPASEVVQIGLSSIGRRLRLASRSGSIVSWRRASSTRSQASTPVRRAGHARPRRRSATGSSSSTSGTTEPSTSAGRRRSRGSNGSPPARSAGSVGILGSSGSTPTDRIWSTRPRGVVGVTRNSDRHHRPGSIAWHPAR